MPGFAYTVLRIDPALGVLLHAQHRRRFAPAGDAALRAFDGFCARTAAGSFALTWAAEALGVKELARSRLFEQMLTRRRPSPLTTPGRIPKPPPEGPYAALREEGVATLLTDARGDELWEEASSAIAGWSGERIVFPPDDRPRVLSTSEEALRELLPFSRAPIAANDTAPLLLLNAVKGTCAIAGRTPFPPEARARIDDALRSTAQR